MTTGETKTTYDILDRPTGMKLPGRPLIENTYSIGSFEGVDRLMVVAEGYEGKETKSYTKGGGVVMGVVQDYQDPFGGASGDLVTKNEYNGLDEVLFVTNPEGQILSYKYDDLGRVIEKTLPDDTDLGPRAHLPDPWRVGV